MSRASTWTHPATQDKNYQDIFWTEWDAKLEELWEIMDQRDCIPGHNFYTLAELHATLATAPNMVEGESFKSYAPQQGKDQRIDTDIFGFCFKATYDFQLFGHQQRLEDYARLQAEIMAETIKVRGYNLLNRGFNEDFKLKYDDKPLFALDHPLANGGTASNTLAVPADLSEAQLEALAQLLEEMVNEDGVFMSQEPGVVCVNTAQAGNVVRYTQSNVTVEQAPGKSGNAVNAYSHRWGTGKPHISPHIQDRNAVYMFARDMSPLKWAWAEKMNMLPLHVDPDNLDVRWRTRMRGIEVAESWRGVVASEGTS